METKVDARTLDSATQAHLRHLVVLAVRSGMKQGEASQKYQVSLRAVNNWVARSKVGGLRALKPKRRGRPRGQGRLTTKQAAHIRRVVIGKMPDQLKLPFYLWTRVAVVQLIAKIYGLRLSLTSVGRYLKAWGLKCPEAGTAGLRTQRRGHCSLARGRLSGYRPASQTREGDDVLGR